MKKSTIINLGPLEDIPMGQGLSFIIDDEEMAVFRARDGKVRAIGNRCPHRGGDLADGIIGDGQVMCPLHGHKFDLETGQGHGTHECVRVFEVEVKEGNVLVKYARLSLNDLHR